MQYTKFSEEVKLLAGLDNSVLEFLDQICWTISFVKVCSPFAYSYRNCIVQNHIAILLRFATTRFFCQMWIVMYMGSATLKLLVAT
jgi:hypothetical protein